MWEWIRHGPRPARESGYKFRGEVFDHNETRTSVHRGKSPGCFVAAFWQESSARQVSSVISLICSPRARRGCAGNHGGFPAGPVAALLRRLGMRKASAGCLWLCSAPPSNRLHLEIQMRCHEAGRRIEFGCSIAALSVQPGTTGVVRRTELEKGNRDGEHFATYLQQKLTKRTKQKSSGWQILLQLALALARSAVRAGVKPSKTPINGRRRGQEHCPRAFRITVDTGYCFKGTLPRPPVCRP